MPDGTVKDQQWWEDYFGPGGSWERNGGRRQTRRFAEEFTKRLEVDPLGNFSILDAGCALGDAISHFSTVFPNASLYGIDFSETAIGRCRSELKNVGHFDVADIESIHGYYDIIYCSNTLEHFPDYENRARTLARHCARLCILVPYRELREGRPLSPCPREHHQHTFDLHSFSFLVDEGLAGSIRTFIFSCPGAWGWESPWKRRREALKNIFRPLLGRPKVMEPLQIFYDIKIGQ